VHSLHCVVCIVPTLASRSASPDRNAIMTSRSGSAIMILVVRTGVNGRQFLYGFRKLPMDQYSNCRTVLPKVCNLTNPEK